MPSAASNSNQNKSKLMKQTSVGSQKHTGGGGGGGAVASNANAMTSVNAAAQSNNPVVVEPPMSSAVDKCAPSNASAVGAAANAGGMAADANNPLRQVLITIDHKIRNLEKRKTKLESYQAIQANGKELSSDQKAAVAKYDAVMATLDFARDLSKQMVQLAKDAEKEQKKQARKETLLRAQVETAKIREVLIIQNILSCFADETVRADFLNGENGAIKLEMSDMELLEQFCSDTQTRRPESADDPSFVNVAQKVAEYFSMTIDGRPKQYGETTYENMRRLFNQIHECGYLDKIYLSTPEACEANEEESASIAEAESDAVASTEDVENLEQGIKKLSVSESAGKSAGLEIGLPSVEASNAQTNKIIDLALQQPSAAGAPMVAMMQGPSQHSGATTTPVHLPTMYASQGTAQQVTPAMRQVISGNLMNVSQSLSGSPAQLPGPVQRGAVGSSGAVIAPVAAPANAASMQAMHGAPPPNHFGLTTVHAVEQDFFKQHQQQKLVQQIRPLSEVISSGSFYFLQESELDSPDILTNATASSVNSGTAAGNVFEAAPQPQQLPAPAGNLMNRVSDLSQKQQQQQKGHVHSSDLAGGQSQQPQAIVTQTFTNQTFPPIQQQQSLAQDSAGASAAVSSSVSRSVGNTTPSLNSNSSSAPSPMFQQQQQQQSHKPQLFSPVAVVQQQQHQQRQEKSIDLVTPNAAGSAGAASAVNQQQQQQLTILQRLTTQASSGLPSQQVSSSLSQSAAAAARSHASGAGFPFEHSLVNSLGYDQQIVQQQLNAALKSSPAAAASSVSDDKSMIAAEAGIVNGWEATIKSANVHSKTSGGLAHSLKQGDANSANAAAAIESPINTWSSEMSAMGTGISGGASASTTVASQPSRKNDWASSSGSNYGSAELSSSDANNHWTSHQMQDNSGGYGGRNSGRGSNNSSTGYRRSNDDRRSGDHRGNSGGGGYRGGRSNNNYGSGSSQSQSQNSNGPRGGGGNGGNNNSIYFRNNDGSSNPHNQYYQNGIYGKEQSRYDMGSGSGGGGGGNGSYRTRTSGGGGNGSGPRNQAAPRSMGRSSGGGNSNGSNSAGSSYMSARQANRMPLGAENKN